MTKMECPQPAHSRFHSNGAIFDSPHLNNGTNSFELNLVDPALETLRDIADIGVGGAPAVTEIVGVDAARVVLAERRVDGLRAPLVTPVLEVCLVVLGASDDHGSDLVLVQSSCQAVFLAKKW